MALRHYLYDELLSLFQSDRNILNWLDEGSLDGIWYWDLENESTEWMSPKFWKMLGYDPEKKQHLVAEWQDIIHPEDLEKALTNFRLHYGDPSYPYDQDVRYRHKNGSTVWVRCRGLIIRGDDGTPRRMLGVHTNITSLKKTKERVETLSQAIDGTRFPFFVLDAQRRIVEFNSATASWFKVNEHFLNKIDLLSFIDEGDHQNLMNYLSDLNEGICDTQAVTIQYRCGSERCWGLTSISSIHRHNQSEPGCFSVTILDITEHNVLKARIEEANAFKELMINSTDDMVFVKDQTYKIVVANAAFLSIFPPGQQPEEVERAGFEGITEDEAGEYLKHDKEAFEHGKSKVTETITVEGRKRIFETTRTRFEKKSGEVFILGMSRDVTDRENLLRKLKQSNEDLDQFAFIASHDLKEPLRTMQTFSSYLKKDLVLKNESRVHEDLNFITDASKRMANLIDDLLQLSRAGNSELFLEPILISDCVKAALRSLEALIQDSNASIHTSLLNEILIIDKSQVSRVFQNLIANSIKFTPGDRRPEVSIVMKLCGASHPTIEVAIKDNGIGFNKDCVERIFQPFTKLHGDGEFNGAGMGLSIARKIIKRHDGEITASSEPGDGAEFKVILPAKSTH